MKTRIVSLLFVTVLVLACAGRAVPPDRYRVSGMASTSSALGAEKGVESYLVQLEGGVEYTIQAAITSGTVRIGIVIRNSGRTPVRYDMRRTLLAAADGGLLRLVATEEEPSSRPTELERISPDYLSGVRGIAPGQQSAITRRFELADGLRLGRDPLLLARLSLDDVLRVGDHELTVALRLVQVR